jgi:hypothetical protein
VGPADMDGRNELPTENTSTLKKSFSKSIKNSSHNPSSKLDTSKKLLNLAIFIKFHQIYNRISCTKNQRFEKTPLFCLV